MSIDSIITDLKEQAMSQGMTWTWITFISIPVALLFMTFSSADPLVRYIAPMIVLNITISYAANRQGRYDALSLLRRRLPQRVLRQDLD